MRIAITTGLACWIMAAGTACAVAQTPKEKDAPVSGLFKGNGQEAKLAFASARKGEPFGDKPTIELVFTEKDHSKEPKPGFKASFGDFGSALVITITNEGKIIGCQVAHAAHAKSGFSSVGSIKMSDFKTADGKVRGYLATDGVIDTFGEKWEVKLKFAVPVP